MSTLSEAALAVVSEIEALRMERDALRADLTDERSLSAQAVEKYEAVQHAQEERAKKLIAEAEADRAAAEMRVAELEDSVRVLFDKNAELQKDVSTRVTTYAELAKHVFQHSSYFASCGCVYVEGGPNTCALRTLLYASAEEPR